MEEAGARLPQASPFVPQLLCRQLDGVLVGFATLLKYGISV
jgi:hypothetical protein